MICTTRHLPDWNVVRAELRERVELITCEFDSKAKLTFVISSPGEDFGVQIIISLDIHNCIRRSSFSTSRWRRALFLSKRSGVVTIISMFEFLFYSPLFSIHNFVTSSNTWVASTTDMQKRVFTLISKGHIIMMPAITDYIFISVDIVWIIWLLVLSHCFRNILLFGFIT